MTSPASNAKRVVSLNGLGRHRSPGQRILNECRDLLVASLCDWLRDTSSAVSEELFVLADSTRDRLLQTRYLDLRADIEKDWQHLVETFRRNLSAEAERAQTSAVQDEGKSDTPLEIPDFEGLQLLDDTDLSEHIVIREFSAQLSETCDEELYTLNRRVATLLGREECQDTSDNPLAPAVICQALSDSCAAFATDPETRLILLRRLERHLHLALPGVYKQINANLVERGILPDLKRTYRRAISPAQADALASPSADGTLTEPAVSGSFPGKPEGESILDALQRVALARSVQGQLAIPGGVATAAALPGNTLQPPSDGKPPAAALDSATINQLLLTSLNERQHAIGNYSGDAILNQVRAVRDSDEAKQVSGLEAVTMDIVAMLFDFIFDDARIPVAIKALISRLQIPVLKVAMLNPGFFGDRQHPTRRFLASISGISIRWGNAVDESDPFYAKLSTLIDRIQTEFEEDIEIFGVALEELEAFVSEREVEENDTALTVANIVIQREIEADAWERAQHAVRSFLKSNPQPEVVANFLSEYWVAVLQKAAAVEEDTEGKWSSAHEVMKDLAWSITPKKTPDDRLKLISLLPRLLGTLNKGLDETAAPTEQRSAFFDAMVKFHSAALKGDTSQQTFAEPQEPPSVDTIETPIVPPSEGDLLVTRSIDSGVEVEEVILVGASPVWRASDRDIFQQVNELQRGDWVEFIDEDGKINRERLNWISPQRGILLFSNHRSAKAISIAPDALTRQIRDGKASIVHEELIFERALNGALESIKVT